MSYVLNSFFNQKKKQIFSLFHNFQPFPLHYKMAHHAAWEGTEDGEEAVEEVATTIFQKIVRS